MTGFHQDPRDRVGYVVVQQKARAETGPGSSPPATRAPPFAARSKDQSHRDDLRSRQGIRKSVRG